MARRPGGANFLSRREFLRAIGIAPAMFTAAPLHGLVPHPPIGGGANFFSPLPLAESRFTPHYPGKPALEDILRLVPPGSDDYVTEKYAAEIAELLNTWSQDLRSESAPGSAISGFLSPDLTASALRPIREAELRTGFGIEVKRRFYASHPTLGRDRFLNEMAAFFAEMKGLETAEFQVVAIEEPETSSTPIKVDIRYNLVAGRSDETREQRIGLWHTQWLRGPNGWQAVRWEATEETVSRTKAAWFADVTSAALGATDSYQRQMTHGADYWRTVLDGACGIDVYGNNGVAVADIDNDGFDDLYVCQPPGLPNRLYRNRGDGSFEDVTQNSGLGLLDATSCALFADFENKGVQDLLVVCAAGPQLFLNRGGGKFERKADAFQFAQPPQGTFTHAAIADFDGDGRLDIYFCLYSYYLGLDQYHYPAPYFDARNGPPNFLLHNEGNARFTDRTEAAGLNAENDRYSFACAWGDFDSRGVPSLYVVNDFGRNNLYRNNGDGTFNAVSEEAHVNDVGAGMSACWADFDNHGKPDLYASNMWSAAGQRISRQKQFHAQDPEEIRSLYRRHASGNSLYRNLGHGKFANVSSQAGVEMGRWAWGSDAWDVDQDGYPDLYIANGYISGPDRRDLGSFFWRHVVGNSPSTATPSANYELGWNAINESIRSDLSWSGYERNTSLLNNRDGTFSDVSGAIGMDFLDDSRCFALADLDHDGRLEVVLKNRNAPQLRVLHNTNRENGNSISFRLTGTKSNRDAIGASVTVEAGELRQTKFVQAGSGFLAQHTKELFFGVGGWDKLVRATILWPSSLRQSFDHLPSSHRIEILEGSANFAAVPFATAPESWQHPGPKVPAESLPASCETWLIEPLKAPDFSLADLAGELRELRSFQGKFTFLFFWNTSAPVALEQLRTLNQHRARLSSQGVSVVGVNLDDPLDLNSVKNLASKEAFSFPNLLATPEMSGIYNILYRYLFDRRRDMPVPVSFLIDPAQQIVKLYQAPVDPHRILVDVNSAPRSGAERIGKALPCEGVLPEGGFQRNDFTYGVAMFQRGYLREAAESFRQVIAAKPQSADAFYNLGTLYLRENNLAEARSHLERAVELRPNYAEAWNNLGMIAAQQGRPEEAVDRFRQALRLQPGYVVALVNLGNFYRRARNFDDAEKLFAKALAAAPDDPEANYGAGMLDAQREKLETALQFLGKAVQAKPDYADALNNIGVILVRQYRYADAEKEFKACIGAVPNFDQAYINLARLYVVLQNDSQAREVLNRLLALQPGNRLAQRALEMLR